MKFGIDLILTTLSKTSKQVGILILSVVLTRYLTQLDYGTYLHVQIIANIAIWSFMLGIPHSIYYFLPKVRQQRRLILTTVSIVLTISTLVGLGILASGDALAALLNNPSISKLILVTAALAFLQIPMSVFEPTMIAANRVRMFVLADSTFNIGFFFAILIPAVLTSDIQTILTVLACFHGIQLIIILGLLIYTAAKLKPTGAISNQETEGTEETEEKIDYAVGSQLKYALPIGLSQGIFELARYGDKVIVSHFFDPATLAVYTRGAMDIPLLAIVNNTIDNLMMPQLMEAYKNQCAQSLLKIWHDTIALTASFMYPSFFFLVLAAPYLIPGLYGASYIDAVPIFQIYTCGLLFRVTTYNVIIRVIGKTGMMAWVALTSETANIVGTILLVKNFGLWGAPFATVLSAGLIASGYLIGISRRLDVPIRNIFPWRVLGGIASLAAIAAAAMLPLHQAIQAGQIQLGYWSAFGLLSASYTLVYWALMRFLPVLNEERRAMFRSMLPGKLKVLV